jgi:CheY-like chemotaxis protein
VNNQRHILVADDCEDDFLLLEVGFRKCNLAHKLYHVPDGERAIMYLEGMAPYHDRNKFPFPDLLILDVQMPNGNGFEVLERLQERHHIRIPVLMFSSSNAPRDIETSMRLGATDYLVKPLSLEGMGELATVIDERWLQRPQPRQMEVEGRESQKQKDY